MSKRSEKTATSSRIPKLKFKPKPPDPKKKKARASSSNQKEAENNHIIDKDVMTRLRTRSAAKNTAAGTDGDNNDEKPQPSSQAVQAEVKLNKYIQLPMRPDNTNSEELNKEEFGQTSLTSSEMEASVNPAKVLHLEKENENDETRMLLFKFPNALPYEIRPPNAEETESKGKTKAKSGCNLQQLPAGYVGKMLVYKSGKIKMKLGDIPFDVNPGTKRNSHEQLVAVNTEKAHLCTIGNIEEYTAVVTPDIDALLEGSKN